jgi:hypothetical protein
MYNAIMIRYFLYSKKCWICSEGSILVVQRAPVKTHSLPEVGDQPKSDNEGLFQQYLAQKYQAKISVINNAVAPGYAYSDLLQGLEPWKSP